jgi:hypothetical protein
MNPKPLQKAPNKAFVYPQFAAVMRVLCCNPRGMAARLKPEGVFKIFYDPGEIAHLMFFREGVPYAVAVCTKVERVGGTWSVHYTGLKWLTEEEPE